MTNRARRLLILALASLGGMVTAQDAAQSPPVPEYAKDSLSRQAAADLAAMIEAAGVMDSYCLPREVPPPPSDLTWLFGCLATILDPTEAVDEITRATEAARWLLIEEWRYDSASGSYNGGFQPPSRGWVVVRVTPIAPALSLIFVAHQDDLNTVGAP